MPNQATIDKMIAAMPSHTVIDKLIASMPSPSAIEKMVATMPSQSIIDKMIASMPTSQATIDKMIAAMPSQAVIDTMVAAIPNQSAIVKMVAAMSSQPAIEKITQIFSQPHNRLVSMPNCLSAMVESMAQVDSEQYPLKVEENEIDDKLSRLDQQLHEVTNDRSFIKIFQELPSIVQLILVLVFSQVIIPQVNSISANLLTPFVQLYLEGDASQDSEKIEKIKHLPLEDKGIISENLCFITGNNVRLRKEGSTNSKILDEMILGQVVTILSEKKNWLEIMYQYDDGEILHGWVFVKYTEKFANSQK